MGIALADHIVKVRQFIRDFPRLNELKGIEESKDSDLMLYSEMALDDYNLSPPLIAPVRYETFPNNGLLILGTICYSLLSNGILQIRNNLQYQDGGVSVQVWDKGPAYIGNAQFLSQMWETKKHALKRSINLANGYGIIQSSEWNLYNYMTMYGGDYIISSTANVASPAAEMSYPDNSHIECQPGHVKLKSTPIVFSANDFVEGADPETYSLCYYHNLLYRAVNVMIEDPISYEEITDKFKIARVTNDHILIKVRRNPDERRSGLVQCSIP